MSDCLFFFSLVSLLQDFGCHTLGWNLFRNIDQYLDTSGRKAEDFPVTIVLHLGSTLSFYLFAVAMDEIIRNLESFKVIWYDVCYVMQSVYNCVGLMTVLEMWGDTHM